MLLNTCRPILRNHGVTLKSVNCMEELNVRDSPNYNGGHYLLNNKNGFFHQQGILKALTSQNIVTSLSFYLQFLFNGQKLGQCV